ncbi:RdgB/HAM1 family non-canonical purine NTP pyrophosphatase [Patescibacteria group bacterium]|nr:RdgB/HAM1 family non-canonical purine NTP pyrophosphatase [Patescibacteria group bacterium]
MKRLLIATNNRGKMKEIKSILKDVPLKVVRIWDIDAGSGEIDIKETGTTFAQNAAIKAEALGKVTGLLTLADDSGLEIDALGGKPGVRSARFAESNKARIEKVLRLLKGVPRAKRSARFKAAVAIYDPETDETKIFEGETAGQITYKPRGNRGFGYDPIFYSTELKKTFGRATLKEKNSLSHRARALAKAKRFLRIRSQASK